MCRLAAYLGPPITLAQLLFERKYSLEEQAYAPREMVHGRLNVDGTGVAWWRDEDPQPLRYTTTAPPWADPNLVALSRRLAGHTVLATVRSATIGIPTALATTLPFELDGVVGSHNGFLRKFREATAARCLAKLPEALVGEFEGLSDSLAVFLLAAAAWREDPDLTLTGALIGAVGTAARICADADADCSLNVVLAAENEIVAARFARGVEPNSLYLRDTLDEGTGAWLASEPLDDEPGWTPVAPDHLVRMTPSATTITPLQIEL